MSIFSKNQATKVWQAMIPERRVQMAIYLVFCDFLYASLKREFLPLLRSISQLQLPDDKLLDFCAPYIIQAMDLSDLATAARMDSRELRVTVYSLFVNRNSQKEINKDVDLTVKGIDSSPPVAFMQLYYAIGSSIGSSLPPIDSNPALELKESFDSYCYTFAGGCLKAIGRSSTEALFRKTYAILAKIPKGFQSFIVVTATLENLRRT